MQVLLVTTSYPLNTASVSGIFVARLARYLKKRYTVAVIVPGDWNIQEEKFSEEEIKVLPYRYAPRNWQILAHSSGGIPVALKRNPGLYLLVPGFLASMFFSCLWQTRKANVIHANWAICGLVAGIAGKLLGVPVVVSLRGEDVTRSSQKIIDRWILKGCLVLCDRVIGVSSAIVKQLQEVFPKQKEKYLLVENGVEECFLTLQRRYRPGNELKLVTLGSLIPRKGIDVAIKAISVVPGVRLTVIGDGPEKEKLQQLVNQLEVSERVALTGWLKPNFVLEQLARHDVLVLSSYSEGRPNVVLEAMATAMAVVASDIDGVNELVDHNHTGMLFPAGDSDSLSGLLKKLKDDADLVRILGENGRKKMISKGLIWEQTAAKYSKIYDEVTGGGV